MRITTLVPLLFCSVNSSAGRRSHGRVGDDGSFSQLPSPCAQANLWVIWIQPAWLGSSARCMDIFSVVYSSFCIGTIKMYSFFYPPYWSRLLLIVCVDVSNPGPVSDKSVQVLYSNILGLHANLDQLAVAVSDYDSLKCLIAATYQSSISIRGVGCPQQRLWNSTPGVQAMDFYIWE